MKLSTGASLLALAKSIIIIIIIIIVIIIIITIITRDTGKSKL